MSRRSSSSTRAADRGANAADARVAPWANRFAWAVIALGGAMLAWIALALHPVGDYFTESDFYGLYAGGARLIQHGIIDPSRYPVAGPVYDIMLAVAGWIVPDLFTAAKLLSVAAAVASLTLWYLGLRARIGATAAAWATVFLAINPVFVRYGYSATTDMVGVAWVAGAAWALLAGRGPRAIVAAGVFSALASLTRYNAILLAPAAIAVYAWLVTVEGVSRRRAILLYCAGFAVVTLPWIIYSLARGSVPGATLFSNFGFYLGASGRDPQSEARALVEGTLPPSDSLGKLLLHDPLRVLLAPFRNVPGHLTRDVLKLVGLPAAALAGIGLLFVLLSGAVRRVAPLLLVGGALFLSLAPVFYSDRYAMVYAPVYLALAGFALASPLPARLLGRARWIVALAIGVLMVAFTARWSIAYQHQTLREMPLEVAEAGRALGRIASPGERVMSRKAHIGYYAGLPVVAFPRLESLHELADYAARNRASYLYYSWYECQLRPEFAYLLDSTCTVPGLTPIDRTLERPSATFRIGPGFGRDPAWFDDDPRGEVHGARVLVATLPDTATWRAHLVLAADAIARGEPEAALEHARRALGYRPDQALGWLLEGEAARRLGRVDEARSAYRRVLAIDPTDAQARTGLDLLDMSGRDE